MYMYVTYIYMYMYVQCCKLLHVHVHVHTYIAHTDSLIIMDVCMHTRVLHSNITHTCTHIHNYGNVIKNLII